MATVVLLHGFAASNFTWRDVEAPLRDAGHDVIPLERPFVAPRIGVDLTIDELDRRELREVVLVGHSAGTEIAVHVAAANPRRVCGLVLCAPVIGGGPPAFARVVAGALNIGGVAPRMLRMGVRVGLDRALKQTWHDKSKVTPEIVEGFRRPLLEPGVAESLWKMTAEYSPLTPDWDALRTTPVLVVKGAQDKWVTPVPLPKAEHVTYDSCGHLPHEECAERFVQDVLGFVDRVT